MMRALLPLILTFLSPTALAQNVTAAPADFSHSGATVPWFQWGIAAAALLGLLYSYRAMRHRKQDPPVE